MGKWSKVGLKLEGSNLSVSVNDKVCCTNTNYATSDPGRANVKVYVSDPWYKASKAKLKDFHYENLNKSTPTHSGNAPQGSECHFPFKYKGKTYDSCTDADHNGVEWCYVKTKSGGLSSKWGECPVATLLKSTSRADSLAKQLAKAKADYATAEAGRKAAISDADKKAKAAKAKSDKAAAVAKSKAAKEAAAMKAAHEKNIQASLKKQKEEDAANAAKIAKLAA
jgi:hypothetical protein